MSPSSPAFLALSAMRCFSAWSCCSCLIRLPWATYFPFCMKWNFRPLRSLGAPSKLGPAFALLAVYGFAPTAGLGVGTGIGVGVGVGWFRVLALIEANLGCIGLYLSFFVCAKTGVWSSKRGCAVILRPAPCWVCSTTGVPAPEPFFLLD